MTGDFNIIKIHPESLLFQSDYVPLISFKSQEQRDSAELYIIQEVEKFFSEIIKLDICVNQISYSKTITEKDFKTVDISYFYENLFDELGERNSEGELKMIIKWGITFDRECAPIRIKNPDPTSRNSFLDRRYGTIDINGTSVFYYIYFTLQEILDVIKQLPSPAEGKNSL